MKEKIFYWRNLRFEISNPDIYSPKPASLLLSNIAIKTVKPKEKVLDMCTGCGIVAIAIKKFVPNAEVFASDINPKAISLTRLNARKNEAKIAVSIGNLCNSFANNELDVITVHLSCSLHN